MTRTANQAYYASKQELKFAQSREGRKKINVSPAYKQETTDGLSSANKYYASKPVVQTVPTFNSAIKRVILELVDDKPILPDIVAQFMEGATAIVVKGTQEQLSTARLSLDLAVGRNTVTREQADSVVFVPVVVEPAPEPVEVIVEEPVVEEPVAVSTDETVLLQTVIETPPEEAQLLAASPKVRRRKRED